MKRSTLLAGGLSFGLLALGLLAYMAQRPEPAPVAPPTAALPKEETPPPPPPSPEPRLNQANPPKAAAAPPETPPDPDGTLPPPSPDQIKPRPERPVITPTEVREQKQASLDLVLSSIDRLEKERQNAERAGDVETAKLNQIRLDRLRKREQALKLEIEGKVPGAEEGTPPGAGTPSPPAPPGTP